MGKTPIIKVNNIIITANNITLYVYTVDSGELIQTLKNKDYIFSILAYNERIFVSTSGSYLIEYKLDESSKRPLIYLKKYRVPEEIITMKRLDHFIYMGSYESEFVKLDTSNGSIIRIKLKYYRSIDDILLLSHKKFYLCCFDGLVRLNDDVETVIRLEMVRSISMINDNSALVGT